MVVKKTWWIAWLLAATLLFLPVSQAFAATSTSATGFKIWPAKTTTEVNKVWTISFNAPLLSTSVNSNTVYVTDSKQIKVATTIKLSTDGLSVTVTPAKAYTAGDYNLYITNGVKSRASIQLSEMIIVPFSVLVPSSYAQSVNLVVSVTDDFKAVFNGDLSGALTLEDQSGSRIGSSSRDFLTGKYTFNIYEDGDYSLNLFSVSNHEITTRINGVVTTLTNSVVTTRSMKLPTIKLPNSKLPVTGPIAPTVKTANFIISSKAGVDGGKSGAIGGSILQGRLGVPVKVANATTTWTTTSDIDGKFTVYLPIGSYQLDVGGTDDRYMKHRYKLNVSAGQMASPLGAINVEEPINKLGLSLGELAVDEGSGILSGIDSTTKQIVGSVNLNAVVEIYDTAPAIPLKIVTVKPDQNGNFVAKLPNVLTGKKLQIKVIDFSENVYLLDMVSVIS